MNFCCTLVIKSEKRLLVFTFKLTVFFILKKMRFLFQMCPACGHLAYFWENWKLRTVENPVLSTVLVFRVTRLVGSAHKFAVQIARLCSPSAREFKSLCTNSGQNKKAQTIKRLSVLFGPSDETCGLCPQFASQNPDCVRLRRGSSSLCAQIKAK